MGCGSPFRGAQHAFMYWADEIGTFTRSQFDALTTTTSAGGPLVMSDFQGIFDEPEPLTEKELKQQMRRESHKRQNKTSKRGYHGRNL